MNFLKALIIGVAAAAIAVAMIRLANWDGASQLRLASQPAFDRVMATHTLRCISGKPAPAYASADPEREIRRNASRDIVERMGHILGLQVEWVEDVSPDQVAGHLASGTEDAMCFPLWPSGSSAAKIDTTVPIDYIPVYAYARADDARFDGDLSKIDDKTITISVIDGTAAKDIADEDFPHALQSAVTEEIDNNHLLLGVTTKKTDVAFADLTAANDFMKSNPGTLKQVPNVGPVRVFGETYAVAKGETKLRDMMNMALTQMQQSGFIRATLDHYLGEHKGEYWYVGKKWE